MEIEDKRKTALTPRSKSKRFALIVREHERLLAKCFVKVATKFRRLVEKGSGAMPKTR